MTDVAVIGAGIAGLICAQQLTQAGYSVRVVEKSRGLGGRVATRRLYGTCADHGACYLKPKGELLKRFVELLHQRHFLEVWTGKVYNFKHDSGLTIANTSVPTPQYIAPAGMSAVAKFLAQGLDILLNHRVIGITPTPENSWRLTLESSHEELTAACVVIAIPAPQAFMLLEPLADIIDTTFLNKLRSVEFDSCLSVMAGYPDPSPELPDWKAVTFIDDADLAWIGLDSSKRPNSQQPVFVVQSSANFARSHDQTQDLHLAGQSMLQSAAQSLQLPWLKTPEWMQVHRWRYAFPSRPWTEVCLPANTSIPLVCSGDWCGGNLVEGAMLSGLAAAEEINNHLQNFPLPKEGFLDTILKKLCDK
jgi:renalase